LHLYQVIVDRGRRDAVVQAMKAAGVGAAVHYIGVNHHPVYLDRFGDAFPVSDWASESLISLPLHVELSRTDLEVVVSALDRALR
jgi:dTDP-4-amino-4,6-dideoxygalactose transaminase